VKDEINTCKIRLIIAALNLSTSAIAASAQERDSRFGNFKREMMPQLGKKITVVGVLKSGKLGWLVAFKGWGVYIYPINDSSISMMNDINRFEGRMVEVSGTLRYFPEPPPPASDRVEAIIPEHFYFDVAEARTVSLNPPRSRGHGKSRARKTSMLSPPPNNGMHPITNVTASHFQQSNYASFMQDSGISTWVSEPAKTHFPTRHFHYQFRECRRLEEPL